MQLPGVYVRTEDGFGLRPNIGIRGSASDRSKNVTLTEDGVLLAPAPYAAPAAYYFPMVDRFASIEVHKGVGALRFGPRLTGGAIDFTTHAIERGERLVIDASGGGFPSASLYARYAWGAERAGVMAEFANLSSDGFRVVDGRGATWFHRSEAMVKGFIAGDPEAEIYHRLELKLVASLERSNETYLGLTDADFAEDPRRRYAASSRDELAWQRGAIRADWATEWSERVETRLTAYAHVFGRTWNRFAGFGPGAPEAPSVLSAPGAPANAPSYAVLDGRVDSIDDAERVTLARNARSYLSTGLQYEGTWRDRLGAFDHELSAGARLHTDSIDRDHTARTWALADRELVDPSAPRATTLNRDTAWAGALWLHEDLGWRGLRLFPAARLETIRTERDDQRGDGDQLDPIRTIVLPGLGAYQRVAAWEQDMGPAEIGVLAGARRGFSPVAPGQSSGIEPETSLNYEAGARAEAPRWGGEAIGFLNDFRTLTPQCSFAAGCGIDDLDRQSAAGRALIWGAELAGRAEFAVGPVTIPVRATYAWTATRLRDDFDSDDPRFGEVEAGDEIPYVPTHQATARLGARSGRLEADLGAAYTSSMREVAGRGDEGPMTDAILTLDARVGWALVAGLSVYARGTNLLGAQPLATRLPLGARSIRPRFVMLGARYDWGSEPDG